MSGIVSTDLVRAIKDQFQINWQGTYGLSHLARVWENGIHLAEATGANKKVVQLFAVFYDSRRLNENCDPEHGPRGALLAESWRGKTTTLATKSSIFFSLHAASTQRQRLMWTKQSKPVLMPIGLILAGLAKHLIQNCSAPK